MYAKFLNLFAALGIILSLFASTPSKVSAEGVQPTPYFTILYGEVNMADGSPAPTGTQIQFFTTRGELAGEWVVDQNLGILKFTHVYGNDGIGTPGFLMNEPISAKVNGQDFNIWPRITWQNDWDTHHVVISPITKTIQVSVSGGPQSLTFTTDTKILVHATTCNGAQAKEILPGTTVLDTNAITVVCPGQAWEFFSLITLEQGQKIKAEAINLIGWGIGANPYLWIWERKPFNQVFLPTIRN